MGKKRIGVVADDITGSNDIGVMLAKNGFRAAVISMDHNPTAADFSETDALILNTGSRLDPPQLAAEKSRRAAAFLMDCGCDMIHSKTCSVFRGNIGATFDAVQDAMQVRCSMVVAGFPRNGRTTLAGVHYVHGVPVGESAFAHDPVTPIHHSRLAELIGRQSKRPCREFHWQWFGKEPAAQQEHLEELKKDAAYVIFDVRDQKDLRMVAWLIQNEKNICGSSAICEELPAQWHEKEQPRNHTPASGDGLGVLILAGSLTQQTTEQIDDLIKHGAPCLTLSPAHLLEETGRLEEIARATMQAQAYINHGCDVLVYAARETEDVRAASRRLGISDIEAGRRISLAFEGIAQQVRRATGASRYVVAGGETSDAVSRGLAVRMMRIWQEIEPGIPLLTAPTPQGELALVLKSGSFGSREFLRKAVDCLHGY